MYIHIYNNIKHIKLYLCTIFSLQGRIALNYHSDVLGTPDEKNKLFRFVVICGDTKRAFEIKAPDQHTKNEWLQAIKKVYILKTDCFNRMFQCSLLYYFNFTSMVYHKNFEVMAFIILCDMQSFCLYMYLLILAKLFLKSLIMSAYIHSYVCE